MSARDENGLQIKPGHTGHRGPDLGDTVWVVERHDGAFYGAFPSRHDAVGWVAKKRDVNDYEPVPVPVGSFRFDDIRTVTPGGVDGR